MRARGEFRPERSMAVLVQWIASVACLLALGSGCTRQLCPGCTELNPYIPIDTNGSVSCPYSATSLTYAPGDPDPAFLIISGGASHGAWGAGVIAGWPETGTLEPRPNFKVVTGISVGALLATPAFLGSAYDYLITDFFTNTDNDEVYEFKLDFLWTNALQDRGPLREKIDQHVTRNVVSAVAQITDRELYVGTVNLDTSEFCPWNLSTIARKAENAPDDQKECWDDLFRDAIFAASGAPVIAPPVEIDSNACRGPNAMPMKMLHADGGVRARVFIGDTVAPAIALGKRPTFYVIMNGKLIGHPECVEDSFAPLALRTYEMMDHEALFGSLYALMHAYPGKVDLKLAKIPDDYCLRFPSAQFDEFLMTCLYNRAESWVRELPIPWDVAIPSSTPGPWNQPSAPCCSRPMGKCTCTQPICMPIPGVCPPP